MLQFAATIFFMAALIAPLAIMTMMLSQNWNAIKSALRGPVTIDALPENRPARIRALRTSVNRSVVQPHPAARAAA